MKEKIQDLPVFISRKEIAAMLGISVTCVLRNEVELGLDKCKVQWSIRHARYVRSMVMDIVDRMCQHREHCEH